MGLLIYLSIFLEIFKC